MFRAPFVRFFFFRWIVGSARWALDRPVPVDGEQCAVGGGRLAVDCGLWAVGGGIGVAADPGRRTVRWRRPDAPVQLS